MSNSELDDAKEQLKEVRELLAADPNNSEFLTLEVNLLELINILSADTEPSVSEDNQNGSENVTEEEESPPEAITGSWAPVSIDDETKTSLVQNGKDVNDAAEVNKEKTKKKKKSKDKELSAKFEVPETLVILESDSVAEKNRKKRAVKALKNKFREKQKEQESTAKQHSWQSFQKKKRPGIRQGDSIWATSEDIDGKVGVVGKRDKSEYAERKRLKP